MKTTNEIIVNSVREAADLIERTCPGNMPRLIDEALRTAIAMERAECALIAEAADTTSGEQIRRQIMARTRG